jgi:hypothetical protein
MGNTVARVTGEARYFFIRPDEKLEKAARHDLFSVEP